MLLALNRYALASTRGYHVYALISAPAQNLRLVSQAAHNVSYEVFELRAGHEPDGGETLAKSSGGSRRRLSRENLPR